MKSGYYYAIAELSPGGWFGVAHPSSPASGGHHFYVDQEGRIYRGVCGNGILEPHEQCDMGSYETSRLCGLGFRCSRKCTCLSTNSDNVDEQINLPTGSVSFLAERKAALTELDIMGQELIATLLLTAPGASTLPAMELLQSRETTEKILRLLDDNGDGKLSFGEMTNADVVGIAREFAANLDGQTYNLDVDEGWISQLAKSYQQGLKQAILPGMTPDERLPSLPIKGLRSSVNADMLKLFPQPLQ